jgi:superoxide dismutase, Cu-Zn family
MKLVKLKIYIILFLTITIIYLLYTNIFNNIFNSMKEGAVAVFSQDDIYGDVVVNNYRDGVKVKAQFTKLPAGKHGFHIHKAGDLRGEGCHGLCEHYDIGNNSHGGTPDHNGERHTGDLGNIELKNGKFEKEYYIKGIKISDLWGRSIIIHEDEDDLGKGGHEDSQITGHSGKRIGCAIFGRAASGTCKPKYNTTRKHIK